MSERRGGWGKREGRGRALSPREPSLQDRVCLVDLYLSTNGLGTWRTSPGWGTGWALSSRSVSPKRASLLRGSVTMRSSPPSPGSNSFKDIVKRTGEERSPKDKGQTCDILKPSPSSNPFLAQSIKCGSLNPFRNELGTDFSVENGSKEIKRCLSPPHFGHQRSLSRTQSVLGGGQRPEIVRDNSARSVSPMGMAVVPQSGGSPSLSPQCLARSPGSNSSISSVSTRPSLQRGVDSGVAWFGVSLDKHQRVVELKLGDNGLDGRLPESFGLLKMLRYLHIGCNRIRGPLPSSICSLSHLEWFIANGNFLTGPIPPSLGEGLGFLAELNLSFNQLTGMLPPSLWKLSCLMTLHLSHNCLEGTLPPEVSKLSRLVTLTLDHNQLKGKIPSELGGMASLVELRLDHNDISGKGRVCVCGGGGYCC
ncbi:unnamed protein product [Choristocarpus tenellus]